LENVENLLTPPGVKSGGVGSHLVLIAKDASTPSETQKEVKNLDLGDNDGYFRRLFRFALQQSSRELLPRERVARCLRQPVPGRVVCVHRREDAETYYSGLHTCASVWICPICAAKISERRRLDLQQALDSANRQGLVVGLLTLTVPHYVTTDVRHLLGMVSYLSKLFWSGRSTAANLIPGYVGQIRALETTHGENGWHPHLHVLVFSCDPLLEAVEALYSRWAALVEDSGLGTPNRYALTLQDGTYAAKYAGKWGLAEELTKAHVKQGRRGGRTPWAILADYFGGDTSSGRLFQDFAMAFKGSVQLRWSNNLRALLELARERTDEEIAATVGAEDHFWDLASRQWAFIVRNNLRGQVLEVFREGGRDQLDQLLRSRGFE
jgi:hypothetical protein